MQRHAPTSRPKAGPPGEAEATSTLKLGEMENAEPLTISEAALVLNALLAARKRDRRNMNNNEVLQRSLDYVDAFSRFKTKESVEAVERVLSVHTELTKYERAQLGSLGCGDADEAKTLIPSLADKIGDEDLQELLDEIAKFAD